MNDITEKTRVTPSILKECSTNGYKLAREFCEKNPDVNVDELVLRYWFINVIMHVIDTERW